MASTLFGCVLLLSFADEETRDIYNGIASKKALKRLAKIHWRKAQMKLDMLKRATRLEDLKIPPNNKLERLERELAGKYSIRINDQWRIVFRWERDQQGASEIKITDYH